MLGWKVRKLPAVRRTQPINIGQNFFNTMSNYYNGEQQQHADAYAATALLLVDTL